MADLNKYLVPVIIVAYGDDSTEAIDYVNDALDNSDLIREDGIYSVEVMEEETELYE